MDNVKKMLKHLQDRMGKIEAGNSGESSSEGIEKLPSSKNVEKSDKEENKESMKNFSFPSSNNINEKVLDDLKHEIAMIKDKLPNVQLMENQL